MESVAKRCNPGMEVLEAAPGVVVSGSDALAAVSQERNTLLRRLLILNVLLQIFDGVATYAGLQQGLREANPLLRSAFHHWGIVPTLLVVKASAYGLLVFVYRVAREQLVLPALAALAAVYSVCSLIPWLGMLLRVLLRYL